MTDDQREVIECLYEHLVRESQLDGASAEEALAIIEQQGSAGHQADDWSEVCGMVEDLASGFWGASSLFASLEEVDQLGPGRMRIIAIGAITVLALERLPSLAPHCSTCTCAQPSTEPTSPSAP